VSLSEAFDTESILNNVDLSPQYGLLLAFDTEDAEFARGFEVGRLWSLLRENPDAEICEQAHAVNAEMLLRLAEAIGREVWTEDVDEAWVLATFSPRDAVDST
jgi:hypothetical protein